MGKRELVALLSLSSWCLVMVVRFFLPVTWVCLQFVIVVFPILTISGSDITSYIKVVKALVVLQILVTLCNDTYSNICIYGKILTFSP